MTIQSRKAHRAERWGEYIEVNPAVCGGEPVIRGTRIRVRDVLELLAAGHRIEDIPHSFPRVSQEAAIEALRFANELVKMTYRKKSRRTVGLA